MREPALLSNNKNPSWCVCIVLLLCMLVAFQAQATALNQIRVLANNHVELNGDFGADCEKCEILADYGGGLVYAYRPESWQKHRLEFQLLDLGRSLKVTVRVMTSMGLTVPQAAKINARFLPAKLELKAEMAADNKSLFEKAHTDPFGGKGIDRFNIPSSKPACNRQGAQFHDMALFLQKKRFGDARITARPRIGCTDCSPIEVEWYHEPTGFIDYQLAVQYRIVSGICRERIK